MVDRRQVACRLPTASQWAAPDRKAEYSAESYSESELLLERPTAEAKARAKQQRQLLQRRHLQQQHRQAMILRQQLEIAVGTQEPGPAARSSDSGRPDWSP